VRPRASAEHQLTFLLSIVERLRALSEVQDDEEPLDYHVNGRRLIATRSRDEGKRPAMGCYLVGYAPTIVTCRSCGILPPGSADLRTYSEPTDGENAGSPLSPTSW
jgi:hypothetical protein